MVAQLFEGIYIDFHSRRIVGLMPQAEFRHFFAEGTAVTWRLSPEWFTGQAPTLEGNNNAARKGGAELDLATPMGFEPTISTVTGWHV